MSKKLSAAVLLPVYGSPNPRFEEALKSVIFQTRKPNEIVIVDDSGNRAFEIICNNIVNKYDSSIKLKYIANSSNKGLVDSLNIGLSMVESEIVVRMDHDDISLPHRIEVQSNLIELGYDVVGGGIIKFGQGQFDFVRYPTNIAHILFSLIHSNPFAHPSVVFKKSAIDAIGGYKSITHAEDLDLWIRFFSENYNMTNTPLPVLLYRIHESQVSALNRQQQYFNSRLLRKKVPYAIFRRIINSISFKS